MPSVSLNENSLSTPPESQPQAGGQHYPPPPPHQQQPPPPTSGHHQYSGGYPPYPRTSYEHAPPQHHLNNSDAMAVSQQHPYQHPYPPLQQPPMRFPGKPLPGGPSGAQQQQPPPGSGQYPPQQMRSNYPPTGQSISQPTGPTPTLNQLLQPGGSAAAGGASGPGAQGGTQPNMPAHGAHRYPPPPGGYDHNSYNMPPHSKSDYPAGPAGWPPPQNQRPAVNSYGHPPPSFQQQQQQQQQAMYRQNAPPSGGRSSGPSGPPPQHPGQYYQPGGMHHPPPPHQQGFPPPPPQSPHYAPPHSAQRYPGPGSGMRPGESQPPSHYPPGHTPGMSPESSGLAPTGPPSTSSGPESGHPPKSTPPPPQSPSLAQQQMNHAQTNPPSPQQSPRSTPVQSQQQHPPTSTSSSAGLPPSSSPSHRPQGSSPSNSYPPPPDVGDMTGCNSNDSVGGPNASGVRPSPSPTGSASSRSMSPAVGSQNIPVPPRPSSGQSDGSGPPRMSQSPMPGSYPGQQSMAPPTHHGYPPGGKMSHPNAGMIPPGHAPPPNPQHYTQQQGQQHWQHAQHQAGQQGYGARPPHHMMSPYPPPPSQQSMPPNSYPPPRHPVPNHVGGPPGGPPPPQNQYSPYPIPQYGGPQPPSQSSQPWASPTAPSQGAPQNPNSRSHPLYLKQQLQQKMGFSPPPHGQGYGPSGPMGPPQPSNMSSSSPSQTPPPSGQHGPPPHLLSQQAPSEPGDNSNSGIGGNPPNIVSVGPDGANVDDVSQQSTLSNASGASGGEDGPAMPKLRKEGHVTHQNYPSHPATPQSNAVPSPGAASMSSAHEEYGESMNSPGWPRTPASPGLNSHPPPPSEQYKTKAKKPDSLQKLYDMDDNPDRRGFLDKLMQYMDEHNTPITACPTISKNPLDLFRLYFLVKERGGFLEVTKNKTWKDIAGSLGIGASSSAAYTLRKHYTKHLLPFECKFDRGGIDPQPLINQVESTSKKKGAKVAPVPSPGSSNSQDSFQGANNNSTSSLDGFNNMPSSAGGGPPTPYGVHPPSEYNQQGNSNTPTSNSSNASSTTVNNSTPPLRPPTHAPGAGQPSSQPSPQGASTPPQPHSHSGEKGQINASNPFDDLQQQPANQYQTHQFNHNFNSLPQSRTSYQYPLHTPSAGYQGPPGGYPPYSSSSGDQYGGRQPQEAYNQQGYAGPTGYPASGPGRPMYPYPESSSSSSTPPAQSGYPAQGPSPHQSQPASQQPPNSGATPSSGAVTDERYSMGPPPPAAASGTVSYPPHASGGVPPHQARIPPYPPSSGAPGHTPPNGYTNQDYYHSQPPLPNEQGYSPMSGGQPSSQQATSASKHMPPPHGSQNRRLDYPPGKEPPGSGTTSGSQSYPNYPPQGQGQPIPPQQRMPSYDGQGTKGGYMYHPPSSSSSSSGGATGGRDHGSGTPSRSSPSPSPTVSTPSLLSAPHHSNQPSSISLPQAPTPHNTLNKPIWTPSEGWPGSSGQYPPHPRPYPGGPPNVGSSLPPLGTPPPGQSPTSAQTPPSTTVPQSTPPPAWPSNSTPQSPPMSAGGRASGAPTMPPASSGTGQWPHASPPPDHATSRYGPGTQGTPPPGPPQAPGGATSPGNASSLPWTPPNVQGRSGPTRAPFPSVPGKNEMYKQYGPGSPGVMQSSTPGLGAASPPAGGKSSSAIPVNAVTTLSQQPGAPIQATFPCAPPPQVSASTSLPLAAAPPPVATKKEIVFPPDSVEGVTPVLSRRKKLHKNDVAPLEAWRIMMCLKSGLLAETTWALDVLNVLLYDDHSISYFSLTYLPGLLDILLEHLRRALFLIFGNSIGIEMNAEKIGEEKESCQERQSKWYDRGENGEEEEPDLGTPRKKFPRDGHRTLVLQGTTNYTMVSRISRKTVGFVGKDDEPFVLPGPRDWDDEEKWEGGVHGLSEQDLAAQNSCGGLMELTKHVITSFTADLNIVPVVRLIQHETSPSRSRSRLKRRRTSDADVACHQPDQLASQIKTEPQDCDYTHHMVHASDDSELNLDLYRCETKLPNEVESILSLSAPDKSGAQGQSKKLSIGGSVGNNNSTCSGGEDSANGTSSSCVVSKTEPVENTLCPNGEGENDNNSENGVKGHDINNCELHSVPLPANTSNPTSASPFTPALQQNSRKLRKLDQVLDRLKQEVPQNDDDDNEEGCGRRVNGLPDSDESSSMMDTDDIAVAVNGSATVEDTCGSSSEILPGVPLADASNLSTANSCDETSCEDNGSSGEAAAAAATARNCVKIGSILVVDHGSTLKRKKMEDFEDECYTRDEPSLYQVTETQDALARRCLSIFNILRNLTFVPGNDGEFGKSIPFLSLLGKLLLIYHEHPLKGKPTSKLPNVDSNGNETNGNDTSLAEQVPPKVVENEPFDILTEQKEVETKDAEQQQQQQDVGSVSPAAVGTSSGGGGAVDIDSDSCTSLSGDNEWWWEYVHHVREHVLVMIANISGQMDLSQFSEEISRPILDGLLHWATCPAAYGQDPFPTLGLKSSLSPQRLAIEALCKLSVTQGNMDLLLATPPYSRIERLCQLLCRSLCPSEDQVMREFAINLLSYLSAADSGVARTIALQNPCISLLISFIEQAEVNANNISINHGFQVLRDNPEAMGTSLDMLRRAATTLFNLARHPDNRALFVQHEPRLLSLVMSHILEQKVAAIVAQVLFQCSAPDNSSSKYMLHSNCNYDSFYSIARSRSAGSRNKH